MTQIINTALVGLVAFFVLLAVLWLFVDPRAPGLGAAATDAPTSASVRGVEAAWAPGMNGQAIDVEVLVRNAGSAASITQVAYRATLDGNLLAANTDDPPTSMPAGMDAPVRFTIPLPADVPVRMLLAAEDGDGGAVLRLDGTITVRHATGDARLPFLWTGSSKAGLLKSLEEAPQECPGPPAPLCLHAIDGSVGTRGLDLGLTLRNDAGQTLLVQGGTVQLTFDGTIVAAGTVDTGIELAPEAKEDVDVRLQFDDAAMLAWWSDHVRTCASNVGLSITLQVAAPGTEPQPYGWDVLASPLKTSLLCPGSA